jgi:hypothetical protein
MIKFSKFFFCILPFIVSAFILFALNNKSQEKNIPQIKKDAAIEFKNSEDANIEKWHENLIQKLEKINKNQLLVKKNMKVYGPNDLSENKKIIIKIMFLSKLKKEADQLLSKKNDEKIKLSVEKIDEMISVNRQKLYNNNSNLSLLDKIFLDNLNVYIQH